MPRTPAPSTTKPLNLRDDETLLLDSLPKQQNQTPPTDRDAFPMPITIALVEPSSLIIKLNPRSGSQRAAIDRKPRITCQTHTTVFISPSHTLDNIRDQLATYAQSAFGISVTERWRWGSVIVAKCEGMSEVLREENAEFVVSASKEGGWGWRFYLCELERSERGVWESRSFVRGW